MNPSGLQNTAFSPPDPGAQILYSGCLKKWVFKEGDFLLVPGKQFLAAPHPPNCTTVISYGTVSFYSRDSPKQDKGGSVVPKLSSTSRATLAQVEEMSRNPPVVAPMWLCNDRLDTCTVPPLLTFRTESGQKDQLPCLVSVLHDLTQREEVNFKGWPSV